MVGGQTVELVLPARLVHRYDVIAARSESATEQTSRRVVAAALFICWPEAVRKAGAPTYRGDVLDYGGLVIDYLIAKKATMNEIVTAGVEAVNLIIADAVTIEQVEAARGNDEAPGGS